MMKFIFIIMVPFLLISCKNEMIDFDESECSTLIKVTIDDLYWEDYDSTLHFESTLTGGVGQYIQTVGLCWSYNFNVMPVRDSNSIYINYESIVKSTKDLNGDGKIDQYDYFLDGGLLERTFSSAIKLDLTGLTLLRARAFVVFNDSQTIYSNPFRLDLK